MFSFPHLIADLLQINADGCEPFSRCEFGQMETAGWCCREVLTMGEKAKERGENKDDMTGRPSIWFPPRHSHVHLILPQLLQRQHRHQIATARTAIKTSLSSTPPRYRAVSCTDARTHTRTQSLAQSLIEAVQPHLSPTHTVQAECEPVRQCPFGSVVEAAPTLVNDTVCAAGE